MAEGSAAGLKFSCNCGAMHGHITSRGAKAGTHIVCFCQDCRVAQIYFGQPDPAPDPVEILQIAPEELAFDAGREHLAVMQLSSDGMFRWYARCCNAPLATTPRSPKFPFAGFLVKRITDASSLGPITTRAYVPQPSGKSKHERIGSAMMGLLKRVARSRISGSWRNTPFFDPQTGTPVATPTVLGKRERTALKP